MASSTLTPPAAEYQDDVAHDIHPVLRVRSDGNASGQDALAREQAVALEYNGIAHATLLASPTHLEELALGFSFTEGIVGSAAEVLDIEIDTTELGIIVRLRIVNARLHALKIRRRTLEGRTGCGLCGVETLSEVPRHLSPLGPPTQPWSRQAIDRALSLLRECQPLHNLTGATHAAAWADARGELAWTYEDVGRHNALDKLIGRLLLEPIDRQKGFIVISSRASFEMVQKTHAAGIRALVAVSAPTTLAAGLAQSASIMLAGFARDGRFTLYTHPDHLQLD